MMVNEFIVSIFFVLSVISLISVFFTDKKLGFGLASALFMVIFYFLNKSINMVESIALIAFIMGVTLIALEVFIPSFGLIGVSGIFLGGYGFLNILKAGKQELILMIVAALTIIVTVIIYVRLGFRANIFDNGILKTTNSKQRGYNSRIDYTHLLGKHGHAKSMLRPAGRIEIDGEVYDAKSDGDFIKAGSVVEVVGIKDANIIVKEK